MSGPKAPLLAIEVEEDILQPGNYSVLLWLDLTSSRIVLLLPFFLGPQSSVGCPQSLWWNHQRQPTSEWIIPSASFHQNAWYVHKFWKTNVHTHSPHISLRWWNVWKNGFTSRKGSFFFSGCSFISGFWMSLLIEESSTKSHHPRRIFLHTKLPIVNLEAGAPCKRKNIWATLIHKTLGAWDTFQLFNGDLDPYVIF